MFFDIGPLEMITLIILAVLVFGPDKLPKLIQDVTGFIRKVRQFSDNAKNDIRSELGPEFKDFEFEDLNPKTFARKHLLSSDDLGLKEIRNGFDISKEMAEITDAVNGTPSGGPGSSGGATDSLSKNDPLRKSDPLSKTDPLKKSDRPAKDDQPPFDSDAT